MVNQNPEQQARDRIDLQLTHAGWLIQDLKKVNLNSSLGVAVREYQTDVGPVDYLLFVDGKPCGVIEAKRAEEGHRISTHEEQAENYAKATLKHLHKQHLPFTYIATGEVIRFSNFLDPKPRAREIFSFHTPETLKAWIFSGISLRKRFDDFPKLDTMGLRECQVNAITNLENSFRENKPKALVQMATGSGKTFTAITAIYRLLKFAKAKRVLFLVDTKNLGEQAEQEFLSFVPNDDNRKFTELYSVQRLKSSYIANDSQVVITTIQRLYSLLKGSELEEQAEEENPNEKSYLPKAVPPIEYNPKIPIDFFDFIVIDECHRSIYNLWKQVLEYFDAFEIGLTATPDKRTIGYFNQNLVSEYSHEMAVVDGVNVGYDVYLIETQVTKAGGVLWGGQYVDLRERMTRKKRRELQDEDEAYSNQQLDRDIVNPNQIRTIVREFKHKLPQIFADRYGKDGIFEVPKTLVFAKTDSHANDIIDIIREEFGEENHFCKKITYNAEDPKGTLAEFRNAYLPRIAVTVDMIATGTDVRPLECLLFMRDIKSRNYFEQMKGRGTRTISLDDLKKVTPTAKFAKDHFVIVDAIGVTKSLKTDSRPLEKKPSVPLKDLLQAIAVGARDEELFTSLASRLSRLDKQLTDKEKTQFSQLTKGRQISEVAKDLLLAFHPDTKEDIEATIESSMPKATPEERAKAIEREVERIQNEPAFVFTGEVNEWIEKVRKLHEQKVDLQTPDTVIHSGWEADQKAKAKDLVSEFTDWLNEHKDEILALQIFYNQPYRRREVTYRMIQEVLERLKEDKPRLSPLQVWKAYEVLESASGSPKNELIAIVSLIRRVTEIDASLVAYDSVVDKNFQKWIFAKNAGKHNRFTEEQMEWLRMVKDYITNSFHIEKEDFDYNPFNAKGGLGKMWQLFGEETQAILDEMNEKLVA
ncbi:DEAD/DEAH box helicase family protein [Leptospira sp. WS4.C2]